MRLQISSRLLMILSCSATLLIGFNNCGEYQASNENSENAPELDYSPPAKGQELVMGDMLVSQDVAGRIEGVGGNPLAQEDSAQKDISESTSADKDISEAAGRDLSDFGASYWSKGIIPIVFAKGFTAAEKSKFWAGCKKWEDASRINCVAYDATKHGKDNYLFVTRQDSGCWSNFGRAKKGPSYLNLDPSLPVDVTLPHGTCIEVGIIAHELGHAIGMIHEQNRPDRDKYLKFNPANADPKNPSCISNLMHKFTSDEAVRVSQGYDYKSIMHYSEKHCSINGQPTMQPRKDLGSYKLGDAVIETAKLSAADIAWARAVYGN